MTLDALIFSNNRNYRWLRHSIFWVAWIIYYSTVSVLLWRGEHGFLKGFFSAFLEVTVSTPLDMLFCYFVIYLLLPRFLFRGRYITMLLLWILASCIVTILFELYYFYLVPYLRELINFAVPPMKPNVLGNFFSLFSQINMEGCLAAAIKLGKLWYIKQQELSLLKEEKAKTEASAEKRNVQPFFLVDVLERVEQIAEEKPLETPAMIKKIKSLLLYAIYENTMSRVEVSKEVKLLHEYIALSKATFESPLQVELKVEGDTDAYKITPFIILPVAENAFRQLALLQMPSKKLYIFIRVENGNFYMRLNWNKPPDTSTLINSSNVMLQTINKRLGLIYPQSHEIKVVIEVEEVIVHLYINLKKAITK